MLHELQTRVEHAELLVFALGMVADVMMLLVMIHQCLARLEVLGELGRERREAYGVRLGRAENAVLMAGFEVLNQRFLVELVLFTELAALEMSTSLGTESLQDEDPHGSPMCCQLGQSGNDDRFPRHDQSYNEIERFFDSISFRKEKFLNWINIIHTE